jgi:hypothetical protein
MGNSRVLQKATRELTKAKAPSKSRDIIYDSRGQWEHPGQNTRIPGSNITMQGVPYPVYAQPNVGQPQMMYPGGEYYYPGADYVDEYPQMQNGGTVPVIEDAGSFNEEGFWIPDWESMKKQAQEVNAKTVKTKNGSMIYFDDNWNVKSVDDNPQMKRGGSKKGLIPMPKPSKKGLASKAYSRSLEATNRLFTENNLFEKPKDRKRKVFDPNAKYYASGGEYGMPLGAGVSQNFIGNRDNFKVGGIPELPLRDNQVNYDAFVNGFEPMSKKQDGGPYNTDGPVAQEEYMEDYPVDSLPKIYGHEPEDYQTFLDYNQTAPENRRGYEQYKYGDPNSYDHYGMWDALGKPKDFQEALQINPDWVPDEYDGYYHGFSVNPNTGVFLKSGKPGLKEGDTTWMEIKDHYLSPRSNTSTPVYDPELQRFKYIPKEEDGGYIELELTPEEIQTYRDGGYIVEDVSIPSLNNYQDGGTYTYAGRKDSKYKKDSSGNWLISNASTGNKFTPIKDPTGKRAKELNRAAVPEQSFEKVVMPSESTDTQFLKNQMKQIGENRLQDYITAANYEKSVIDDYIKEMRGQDFLSPDERRKGLTNKSKVSKERRNKAIQNVKWQAIEQPGKLYKNIKKEAEFLNKSGSIKALPKEYDFSTSASTYDILTNPLDAFKYSVSTGDISNMPANYNKFVQAGIDPLEHRGGNLMGNTINAYNPIDIGDKVVHYTKEGDYLMAGLNALRALPYAKGLEKVPAIARTLNAADKFVVAPIEAGLKYAPLAKVTRNASPLISTIGKKATVGNALRARAMIHAAQKTPELVDALGNVIKKKDIASLKKAGELGIDVGYNFFPAASGADQYFLSKAAFNLLKPKQDELINTKSPFLGGTAFDYLSLIRNLPTAKAKGGETNYVDTELTDAEIQDLIDEGYIIEQL